MLDSIHVNRVSDDEGVSLPPSLARKRPTCGQRLWLNPVNGFGLGVMSFAGGKGISSSNARSSVDSTRANAIFADRSQPYCLPLRGGGEGGVLRRAASGAALMLWHRGQLSCRSGALSFTDSQRIHGSHYLSHLFIRKEVELRQRGLAGVQALDVACIGFHPSDDALPDALVRPAMWRALCGNRGVDEKTVERQPRDRGKRYL